MELLDRSPTIPTANKDTRGSNVVNRFQMNERKLSALPDRNLSVSLIASLSKLSTNLQASPAARCISTQHATSPRVSNATAQTPSTLTLQARQRKVRTDLMTLKLEGESFEEEIIEKIKIPKSSIPSGHLKNIISSKFGIAKSAKNKHAAAMNVLLRLQPRLLERTASQEELKKMSVVCMKTLINKVWNIYRFSKIMSTYSTSLIERSARMEAEDVMRSGDTQSRDNSDNIPANFPSLLPPRYRKILYKYPESRTESDILQLRVFLRSSINEFRQYAESTQKALCMSMYYTCYEKGRAILRQGQQGKNFYIIISGSLVWMRSDINSKTGEVYTCDNVMNAGEKFGETALMRKTTRTATVVCCEDSELLMVDKDLFDRYCPNLFEEQLREKVRYLYTYHSP
ncbi:hypothetical protein LOD99_6963 [Oopsacas minuta]|uniref:Cyclic nucleotide-binding domain-containing protein n=1 Tax=Oopsacas minuta TaxID=111878 RepID=A0AAV7JKL0_9METZ|nr:hypothetical protein LOD99_6963 [Oopsacas minuta]